MKTADQTFSFSFDKLRTGSKRKSLRIIETERRENELLKLRALALSTHFGQVILSVIYTHNRISINRLLSECQVTEKDLLDFLSLLEEAKIIIIRGNNVALAPQGKHFLANLFHLSKP